MDEMWDKRNEMLSSEGRWNKARPGAGCDTGDSRKSRRKNKFIWRIRFVRPNCALSPNHLPISIHDLLKGASLTECSLWLSTWRNSHESLCVLVASLEIKSLKGPYVSLLKGIINASPPALLRLLLSKLSTDYPDIEQAPCPPTDPSLGHQIATPADRLNPWAQKRQHAKINLPIGASIPSCLTTASPDWLPLPTSDRLGPRKLQVGLKTLAQKRIPLRASKLWFERKRARVQQDNTLSQATCSQATNTIQFPMHLTNTEHRTIPNSISLYVCMVFWHALLHDIQEFATLPGLPVTLPPESPQTGRGRLDSLSEFNLEAWIWSLEERLDVNSISTITQTQDNCSVQNLDSITRRKTFQHSFGLASAQWWKHPMLRSLFARAIGWPRIVVYLWFTDL